jgi:hypothetical protein
MAALQRLAVLIALSSSPRLALHVLKRLLKISEGHWNGQQQTGESSR